MVLLYFCEHSLLQGQHQRVRLQGQVQVEGHAALVELLARHPPHPRLALAAQAHHQQSGDYLYEISMQQYLE